MRLQYIVALSALAMSCGQGHSNDAIRQDTMKKTAVASAIDSPAVSAHNPATANDSAPPLVAPDSFYYAARKSLAEIMSRRFTDSITDWRKFWPRYQKAIAEKDTFTLIGLTQFPFYNADVAGDEDTVQFVNVTLNTFFSRPLKARDKPRFSGQQGIDSSFKVWIDPYEFMFEKMGGCYKLTSCGRPG